MRHDDPEKEALFLRFWPSLACMLVFVLALAFICIPKWFYQFLVYHLRKNIRMDNPEWRPDYIFEFEKAMDQAVCAGVLKGQHDETISNKAGTVWKEKEFASPWWVIWVKKITDSLEAGHIETSIEPLRPKQQRTKK